MYFALINTLLLRYKISIPVTAVLIVFTILVITAFQVYWLRKNYREERQLFTARTNVLFRETIFRLQATKLKTNPDNIRIHERQGMISISSVLDEETRNKVVGRMPGLRRAMVVAINDGIASGRDSINVQYRLASPGPPGPPGKRTVEFLSGVDSLSDSITVKDVIRQYSRVLAREHINVPFTILEIPVDTTKREFSPFPDELDANSVTIGFSKPVTYQLVFEDNTWYLLKRISQPISISCLLLGVTALSFLLLYRNLKQQQKLAQLKNDFISNMTHELKTPIATVSVAIEALRNFDALDDPQTTHEYLDISANEMQRLALLVDKVLKLSMFENREIALNKEQFDIRELARSVMVSMKLQFEKQQATTTLKATGTNFIITADKLHMTSVLYNLLDNALKYSTKDPEILIHIIDHKNYLEIRVTDNGIGIAKEYKNRIFEKFFRIPSGNRHNIKGYGLGLSYVAHIVMSHMGFIEVESELHKGSTFSVKIPFMEAPVIYYDRNRRIGKKIM